MTKRIMVFNDQLDTLTMYVMILEREGYLAFPRHEISVIQADIAVVAPDLIIVDWTYGLEQRGFDLLMQLRTFPMLAQMGIIVCAGSEKSHMLPYQAALREQDVDVLRKPFEVPELLALIEAHLAS